MIHVVTQENRDLYEDVLEDMFRMRYRAAVEEMGWRIDVDQNGRDIDEFDYPDTIYMIYFNEDGTVGACGRLNPTTRPHLMSEVFPQMCEDGVPTGEHLYEYSRYLIERKGKTQQEFMKAWMLITQAVNEYCIEKNIKSVSWLARKRLYGLSTYLWKTRPLGLSKYYEDDQRDYIAAVSVMDKAGLERVQKYSKTFKPVLTYISPDDVAGQSDLLKIAS